MMPINTSLGHAISIDLTNEDTYYEKRKEVL
jgi:hypothetical protein